MTERVGLLERAKAAGRAHLDDAEQRSFDKLLGEIAALDDPIDEVREELKRAGRGAPRREPGPSRPGICCSSWVARRWAGPYWPATKPRAATFRPGRKVHRPV